jgi:prepilin-type processing-associated H-X9-DG protein
MLYSTENTGHLVPIYVGSVSNWATTDPRTYRIFLKESMGLNREDNTGVFKCPSDESANNDVPASPSLYREAGTQPRSYGINFNLSSLHSSGGLSNILFPSDTICFGDIGFPSSQDVATNYPEGWKTNIGVTSWGYMLMPNAWGGWISEYNIYPRHLQEVNTAFYDGHVQAYEVTNELQASPPGTGGCLYDNE